MRRTGVSSGPTEAWPARTLRAWATQMARLALLISASLGTTACGARTGLYADRYEGPDASFGVMLLGDAGDSSATGVSQACLAAIALENKGTLDAGTLCMAGPQLLECDVASTGTHVFPNYCVTSDPNCTAVGDPSCESQCMPSEFGLVCGVQTVPSVPGCRVVLMPGPGGKGTAFCCAC
jgi:hypothetical protein